VLLGCCTLEPQEPSERCSWLYKVFFGSHSESAGSRWRQPVKHPCRSLGYLHIYPTALHVVLPTTPLRARNGPLPWS